MQTIIFTGGGSAGHVTPNIALIKRFQQEGWHTIYIGSQQGIEKEIIKSLHIPYFAIATGKLRRYFSWRNLLTPFQVIAGIVQAYFLCRRLRPRLVFSKGGFVAFPVVMGAWLNRIPVVVHESDLSPGLANRLCFNFAKKICVTFPQGAKFFKNQKKVVITGTPIRDSLLTGNAERGRAFCGLNAERPILLIIGGGLGAAPVNRKVRALLPQLLTDFQIVHLCGKGKVDESFANITGYKQFEYINEELADILACTDLVISRAGANSIYELLALRKPHLLIPLSKQASRGDQIENAQYFAELGLSLVLADEQLTDENLLAALAQLKQQKQQIINRLNTYQLPNGVDLIYSCLMTCCS